MTIEQIIVYIAAPIAGYLLGSIPFALLIGKARGVDIRTVGSKNIGATNLGRTLGPKFFWYAFLLDAAKGFLPVLLATLIVGYYNGQAMNHNHPVISHPYMFVPWPTLPSWSPLLTAIACVLGHTYPLFLKFKGGKGVATSFGVILGFPPLFTLAGIGAGLVFLITLLIFRYISLASIVGVLAFVAFVEILGNTYPWPPTYLPWPDLWPLLAIAALFALLIILRHRANIARLLQGTEPKIRSSRSSADH